MAGSKTSFRTKLFIGLTLLTAVSSVAMIYSGMQLSDSKAELTKAIRADKKIEGYSSEIAANRAKISAQKKAIGGSSVEFSLSEISDACARNHSILDRTTKISDIDRGDYLERGYRVQIVSILKIDLGKLYADLEANIPGCKIKSSNMTALKTGPDLWSVSFVIVKSVPKIEE